MLDHEGGLAQQLDVAPPEGRPRLVPVLEAQQEEGCGPEHYPRAVRHVQHAVWLFPFQLVLDVYRCLGLHCEAHQTQRKQKGGVGVLLPRLVLGLHLWIPLVEVMCAPSQQSVVHVVVLRLAPEQGRIRAPILGVVH